MDFESHSNVYVPKMSIWGSHSDIVNALKKRKRLPDSTSLEPSLKNYLDSPYGQLRDDPVKIWKNLLPITSPFFKITGTSVPSERFFSKAGAIIRAERNLLSPNHAGKLLFLGL
ncbi:hypothetical protein CHUAL_014239 [Chamberlinius hualienensis]